MKKIAILTFTNGTNIGQRLQNYALQTLIEDEGFLPCTIRQHMSWQGRKLTIKQCLMSFFSPSQWFNLLKRNGLFRKFNREHINFSSKILSFSGASRHSIDRYYDGFIVGSDQIWNPNSPFVGENFFLDFVDRKKRLTYAPSFSVDRIPESLGNLYEERLNRFDRLSVREKVGSEIIRELTGKTATVVLDPTLLLDKGKWDSLIRPSNLRPDTNYVLSLFLGSAHDDEVRILQKYVALPIVSVRNDSPVGPAEFLDLVSHADIVLTDSYHVTIFSIIYNKPFINFQRNGSSISMNSRFKTLYSLLDLPDRSWEFLKSNNQCIYDIDYAAVQNKIYVEGKRSKDFLHQELAEFDSSK